MRRPVAVIAGAGEAGAATAVSLAGAGFAIVLVDVRAEVAQAAAAQVVEAGGVAEAHGVDLLDMDSVTALRDQLVERLGGVDVVVHLVGGWRGTRTLEPQSVENWRILHPPIVDTLAVLTTVFAADIAASPRGRVLMVSSTAVSTPTAGNIAYATAKMAW